MPQTQSPNILALIEGTMERLFVNNNFSYVHVIELKNGSSYCINRMKDQIRSKINLVSWQPDHIVIWFDRERRNETSFEISQQIKACLMELGFDENMISIGIPDSMTENWILSDEQLMKDQFEDDSFEYKFESQNGAKILDAYFRSACNRKYKKTTDGPNLLKKARFANTASESAREFLQSLPFDCWWLQSRI